MAGTGRIEEAASQAKLDQVASAKLYQPDSQVAKAAQLHLENVERLRISVNGGEI